MTTEPQVSSTEPGRKSLLITLGVFGSLALIVVAVSLVFRAVSPPGSRGGPAQTNRDAPMVTDPAVLAFLGPVGSGEPFGDYRIVAVEPLRFGRMTVHVEQMASGERVLIDIHARPRNGSTNGYPIAQTSKLALFVRSKPGSRTPAFAAEASAALAQSLLEREEAGYEPPPLETLKLR